MCALVLWIGLKQDDTLRLHVHAMILVHLIVMDFSASNQIHIACMIHGQMVYCVSQVVIFVCTSLSEVENFCSGRKPAILG